MIEKIENIYLGTNAPPTILECTEGDTMWRWHFRIYFEFQRWTIPSGSVVMFTGKKSDGNVFDLLQSVEDNEAVVTCDEQMTAAVGPAHCVLRIIDANGKTVASAPIMLAVKPNPQTMGTMSETVLSAYNDALQAIADGVAYQKVIIDAAVEAADKIPSDIPGLITDWLDEHVDPETGYVIDDSLTVPGAAADAKATGDAIGELKSALDEFDEDLNDATYYKEETVPYNRYYMNQAYVEGQGISNKTAVRACEWVNIERYDYVRLTCSASACDETGQVPNVIAVDGEGNTIAVEYLGNNFALNDYFLSIKGASAVYLNSTAAGLSSVSATFLETIKQEVEFINQSVNDITYTVAAENPITNKTSVLGGATKTVTGDGTKRYIYIGELGYKDREGTFKGFLGYNIRCSKPCTILFFASTPTDNILQEFISMKEEKVLPNAAYYAQLREHGIEIGSIAADTDYYLCCVQDRNIPGTTGASKQCVVVAYFDTLEDANGATLTISKGLSLNLTSIFGAGKEPSAPYMASLLSQFPDHYFDGTVNLFGSQVPSLINNMQEFDTNSLKDGHIGIKGSNVSIRSNIDSQWEGWDKIQFSYGKNRNFAPVPIDIHGEILTDSQFTAIPLYGNWSRLSVTTGNNDWGGHLFHGWNDAMTYRLTMMASGGMTSPDSGFKQREDEFCIHVFSPTGAYNNPIGLTDSEASNRITQEQEDIFSGSAYYGRVRIGADRTDEGFLFRAKSLVCYGRVDLNGNKFILGDQTANVPANATSNGKAGQIAYDSNYVYVCVADNTWKRVLLETW